MSSQTVSFDALNFLDIFLNVPRLRSTEPFSAIKALEARVRRFAEALRSSALTLFTVIDADNKTAEAQRKWKGRRQRELKAENRKVLLASDVLYGEALQENGLRVIRPMDCDADDMLASIAATHDGVLSQDGDMFRYRPQIPVFTGWNVVKDRAGNVKIHLQAGSPERYETNDRSERQVDASLAERALASASDDALGSHVRDKYSADDKSRGRIERGCSSSSDLRLGNLHVLARPLRSAVYARLHPGETLTEVIPIWDEANEAVEWTETVVQPDASLNHLLDDPLEADRWLASQETTTVAEAWSGSSPAEIKWREQERRFNRAALACEMVSAVTGTPMLELLRRFPEYQEARQLREDGVRVPAPSSLQLRQGVQGAKEPGPAPVHTCKQCAASFSISEGHKRWFESKGFALPTRCEACRAAKSKKGGASLGAGLGGGIASASAAAPLPRLQKAAAGPGRKILVTA